MTKTVTRQAPISAVSEHFSLYTEKSKQVAGSCHLTPPKNPVLLPDKWAKTSVATILQQLHNAKVEILRPYEEPGYALRTTRKLHS
jgi:hypothetical protein